ncbi:NAD(P)H-dependent oxidoreductase [Photobacterium atrarenae]|uniref:NAD(P)H-dependent oxidoreductase n=1 Tax=Photobacterium atrarenae TaxID=865757 RepID=A0ABY5GIJ8_9GAMM|nr:NAD(P)H-dependent oxidoreductase [Photobacterium atrarenae]UTV29042.1 NAD(P)H-dependent oxidoreductase [Photobacterium atrarenae]
MKIMVLNGNPKKDSLSRHLADIYEVEAREGAEIRRFNLGQMAFNPSLDCGYDSEQPLEPCLVEFQDALTWADHLVIVAPIWWGGVPAKLKGLLDRAFLPGFAFRYASGSPEPVPLLAGKTARLILTMDAPDTFLAEQAAPVLAQLDRYTLQFSGIAPAEVDLFGSVIMADEAQLQLWGETVRSHGAACR